MEFSIKQTSPEKQRCGCMVVGVHEGGKLSPAAQALDKAAKHAISDLVRRGDMSGKTSSTLLLHKLPGIAASKKTFSSIRISLKELLSSFLKHNTN